MSSMSSSPGAGIGTADTAAPVNSTSDVTTAATATTVSTAARVLRVLLGQSAWYLVTAIVLAAAILAVHALGLVVVTVDGTRSLVAPASLAAQVLGFTTLIYGFVIAGYYIRPMIAAGATRTALALAWAGVVAVAVVVGTGVVLAFGAIGRLLPEVPASTGTGGVFGRAFFEISVVGGQAPEVTFGGFTVSAFVLVVIIALVGAGAAIAGYHRFPWWIATPLLFVTSPLPTFVLAILLAEDGLSVTDWAIALGAVALQALLGFVLLRTAAIRPAIATT